MHPTPHVPEVPGCGLVVWKVDGTIVSANALFWTLVGRAPDAAWPTYWEMTEHGQRQRELNLLLAADGGFEKEFVKPDGSKVTMRILGGPVGPRASGVFFAYVEPKIVATDKEEVERTLRHQNAILLALTKADALDSGNIEEAVRLVTEAGANGLRCARSSVWLYTDGETKIHCHDLFECEKNVHSSGAELSSKDFPGYFDALREDRTIAANDAHTHPATREFSSVYLTPLGITSMLEAPIRSRGKLVGVLCSEHIGPMRKFSQEEQNFAANVADAFGRSLQAAERRRYEVALKDANEQLEATVRSRTASLQTALDSMGDGLIVCQRDGVPTRERSRAVEEWFGPLADGATLWEYLAKDDDVLRANLAWGFECMTDGAMPFEITRTQAPQRIERGSRTYALSYRYIGASEDAIEKLVVLIRDITADLAAERSEAAARELAAVVGHLLRDRDGFVSFIGDTEALLQRLASPAMPMSVRIRALHTLKGNTAIYGFASFAKECHALEDRVRDEGDEALSREQIAKLDARWRAAMEPLSALLSKEGDAAVRVLDSEHKDFITRLEQRADHSELVDLARSWKHGLIGSLLAPYAAQGERLAHALEKKVSVVIDDHGERLPDARFRPFFAELIHCVRNALDHGLELPEERAAAGKSEQGSLRLDARRVADELVVSVSDDGRGIDWERVRAKASAAGLPAKTEQDLVDALVSDGFSTHTEVSELSGRGVGMSAVADACRALGGRFHIETKRGSGTRFVFILPASRRPQPSPRLSTRPSAMPAALRN